MYSLSLQGQRALRYFLYNCVPTTKPPLSHVFSEVKYSLAQISENPMTLNCEIKLFICAKVKSLSPFTCFIYFPPR